MTGPEIFAAIGVGIAAVAVAVARLFGRTVKKQMPGSHEGSTGAMWHGAVDRDGPDEHGGGGGH